MIISLFCNKFNVFYYIKIFSLCKSIVGFSSDFCFIPFKGKYFNWNNKLCIITRIIKNINIGLIVISVNSTSWYKGIGKVFKLLKHDFYCLSMPSHARKLLNRTGLIISKGVYTSVGKSISSINNSSLTRYCLVNNRFFKLCMHSEMTISEYCLLGNPLNTTLTTNKIPCIGNIGRHYNHSKQFVKSIVLDLLKTGKTNGKTFWDIGSGCGGIGLEYKICNNYCVICMEMNLSKLKTCFHNYKVLNYRVNICNGLFKDKLIGNKIPNRVYIGCGIKNLWQWRLVFSHIKNNGLIVLTAVTNSSYVKIGILSSIYKSKLFSLVISKTVLKLNNKLYRTYSMVLICVIDKTQFNNW